MALQPQRVTAFDGMRVIRVACGAKHMIALTSDGNVYTWGNGRDFKLGFDHEDDVTTPTMVTTVRDVIGDVKIVDVCATAHMSYVMTGVSLNAFIIHMNAR